MSTATLPQHLDPNPLPLKHLLASYTSSHPLRSPSPLPNSSRVNPKVTQRLPPPTSSSPLLWTLSDWLLFWRFLTAKGLHVFWSLLKHMTVGPQRKSWGYRMTFITSVMRNVADHTSLADIVLVRRLISLHALVPLPSDAVFTPITFLVPRRTNSDLARGFLHDLDKAETGERELSGEWIVGNDVWKRLKAERRGRHEAARRRRRVSRDNRDSGSKDVESGSEKGEKVGGDSPDVEMGEDSLDSKKGSEKVIYYVHGGAYYVGNAATHRLITIGVSKACNARVFAITYRLAPEHAFPLPLHDVLAGYLRLLAPPLSIAPENIIVAGDSAGGGLSLALCMYLRDEGYQLPSGLVLISPWVDLTMSCGSWEENADSDVVPRPEADDHLNPVGCYLGPKGISTYLTHPYASPLFGDLSGLPPMLIQSGDSEVLRDEVTLLAHKATLSGANVTHELYEDMVHVFQMFTFLPAAQAAIESIGRWVRVTLPKIEQGKHSEAGEESVVVGVDGEEISSDTLTSETVVMEEVSNGLLAHQINGLRLDLTADNSGPTIDVDSLPQVGSGVSTPRSPIDLDSSATSESGSFSGLIHDPNRTIRAKPSIPRLRRAVTSFASPSTRPVSAASSIHRRRRPTLGSASLHVSPSFQHTPIANPNSNPVSPTPSIRRRLRGPSLTSTAAAVGTLGLGLIGAGHHDSSAEHSPITAMRKPTTRHRSASHSDIFHLVEGYAEGGAANETVVYAAGGTVKSVGVLGEEDVSVE